MTERYTYAYDGAGRLVMDSRNGDTDLVTRYGYNVRSAVTEIKAGGTNASTYGATFTELLYYQNQRPTNPQTYVQWAGNVSAMDWKVGSNGTARRYDFTYDNLSRLTGASYGDNASGTGSYNRSYAYDKNGNITSITTPDGTTSLSYSGNQLSSGSNYTYDANGNLTYDAGLRRTIVYNVLNLPSTVNNGSNLRSGAEGSLYLYSASGVKLQSKAEFPLPMPGQPDTRSRKDYVGNLVYEDSSLKTILIDGGYVEVSGTTKNYRYFIQDHLGNNRLVADATGLVLQTNHYGPYGESLSAGASADSGNPYKYSGKEYDAMAKSYDFGARYYVPTTIPRWTTMDPLAEKYYSISPYAYCAGNPIRYTDPTGKIVEEDNLEEWGRLKQRIEKRRDRIQGQINRFNAKAKSSGWSSEKLAARIGNKAERLASLNSSIETMETLEGSTQVYSLSHTANSENGSVTLNPISKVIVIRFGSTANFVHEMTHAGQFESGDIAFLNTGESILQDLYDETSAYKAQFGYSPSSVSGLTSITAANTFDAITPSWVQGLIDATGRQPYAEGSSANTGLIPVSINSSRNTLIQAYPWNAATFNELPASFNLRALQNIYYKK